MYFSLVERLKPNSVLDVGCAQATLALLLAEKGYRVCANDLRQDFLHYAQARYEHGNIRFVCGNVFELQFDEPFDLVFANQLIEHLVYPVEFLAKLRSLVRSGGHVVCTTPSHKYIRNSLPSHKELGDLSQYEDRQFTADGDGHFFAYTRGELVEYADAAGWEKIQPFLFESPWANGHMRIRHLHGVLPYAVLRFLDHLVVRTPGIRSFFCHQLGFVARNPC